MKPTTTIGPPTITVPLLGPGEEVEILVSGPALIRATGRPDDRDAGHFLQDGEPADTLALLRSPEPPARWGVALLIGLALFLLIASGVALWLGYTAAAGLFVTTAMAALILALRQPT